MVDLHENLLNSATSPFGDDTFSTSAPSASCSERHNEKHSCNNASDRAPVGSMSTSAITKVVVLAGNRIASSIYIKQNTPANIVINIIIINKTLL